MRLASLAKTSDVGRREPANLLVIGEHLEEAVQELGQVFEQLDVGHRVEDRHPACGTRHSTHDQFTVALPTVRADDDDAGCVVPMRNDRTNVLVTWIRSLSSGTKLGE